ncbi:MAG: hypothetical protein ACP5N3_06005 [Candidatus Nanoarchaeia archaeon]
MVNQKALGFSMVVVMLFLVVATISFMRSPSGDNEATGQAILANKDPSPVPAPLPADTTPPAVTAVSPVMGYTAAGASANVNFECSATDNRALSEMTLTVTSAGGNTINKKCLTGMSDSRDWTMQLSPGAYTWKCTAEDTTGNVRSTELRTLTVNTCALQNLFHVTGQEFYGLPKAGNGNIVFVNSHYTGNIRAYSFDETNLLQFKDEISTQELGFYVNGYAVSNVNKNHIAVGGPGGLSILNFNGANFNVLYDVDMGAYSIYSAAQLYFAEPYLYTVENGGADLWYLAVYYFDGTTLTLKNRVSIPSTASLAFDGTYIHVSAYQGIYTYYFNGNNLNLVKSTTAYTPTSMWTNEGNNLFFVSGTAPNYYLYSIHFDGFNYVENGKIFYSSSHGFVWNVKNGLVYVSNTNDTATDLRVYSFDGTNFVNTGAVGDGRKVDLSAQYIYSTDDVHPTYYLDVYKLNCGTGGAYSPGGQTGGLGGAGTGGGIILEPEQPTDCSCGGSKNCLTSCRRKAGETTGCGTCVCESNDFPGLYEEYQCYEGATKDAGGSSTYSAGQTGLPGQTTTTTRACEEACEKKCDASIVPYADWIECFSACNRQNCGATASG